MVDFGAKFKEKESLEMGDRHFSKDNTAKQSETDYFGGGINLNASKHGKIMYDVKIRPENTLNKMKKE